MALENIISEVEKKTGTKFVSSDKAKKAAREIKEYNIGENDLETLISLEYLFWKARGFKKEENVILYEIFINRSVADIDLYLRSWTLNKVEAQYIATQVAKHISDKRANDEFVDSAYEELKEYCKSHDIWDERSRVIDAAKNILSEWYRQNKIAGVNMVLSKQLYSLASELKKEAYKQVTAPRFKTTREMQDFVDKLDMRDIIVNQVVDPESGEIVLDKGDTKKKMLKQKSKFFRDGDESLDLIVSEYKKSKTPDFDSWVSENEFDSFYRIVKKDLEKEVENPEAMREVDYDVDVLYPKLIQRKDNKSFTEDDIWNIRQYAKFFNDAILRYHANLELEFHGKESDKTGSFSILFK